MKITVEIDNIKPWHQVAIEDLLYTWQNLGKLGASRITSFYADGDGDFRPTIKVDGREAQQAPGDPESRWTDEGDYLVYPEDFYTPNEDEEDEPWEEQQPEIKQDRIIVASCWLIEKPEPTGEK